MISVVGGLVLGALTGAVLIGRQGDRAAIVAGVALSGMLLTYCVFSSAATELIKHGLSRATYPPPCSQKSRPQQVRFS